MECPRKLLCRGAFDSVEDAQIYKDEISDFLLGEMDETFNPDDYEEVEMEEEGPAKNQPDEDGWVVV